MDIPAIERRQACIGVLVEDPARLGGLQDALAGARDAERVLSRLSLGTGMPRDLAAIQDPRKGQGNGALQRNGGKNGAGLRI